MTFLSLMTGALITKGTVCAASFPMAMSLVGMSFRDTLLLTERHANDGCSSKGRGEVRNASAEISMSIHGKQLIEHACASAPAI